MRMLAEFCCAGKQLCKMMPLRADAAANTDTRSTMNSTSTSDQKCETENIGLFTLLVIFTMQSCLQKPPLTLTTKAWVTSQHALGGSYTSTAASTIITITTTTMLAARVAAEGLHTCCATCVRHFAYTCWLW